MHRCAGIIITAFISAFMLQTGVLQAQFTLVKRDGPWGGTTLSLAINPQTHALHVGTLMGGTYTMKAGVFAASHFGPAVLNTGTVSGDSVRAMAAWSAMTLIVGTERGIAFSRNGGATFAPAIMFTQTAPVRVFERLGGALLAGTTGGDIQCSLDSGGTWSLLGSIHAEVFALLREGDYTLCAGTSDGVHRSSDGGRTWMPWGLQGLPVTALTIDGFLMYAGAPDGLHRSPLGWKSWQLLPGSPAVALSLSPWQHSMVLAGTAQGLYGTSDSGATWAHLFTDYIPPIPIHTIACTDSLLVLGVQDRGLISISRAGVDAVVAPSALDAADVTSIGYRDDPYSSIYNEVHLVGGHWLSPIVSGIAFPALPPCEATQVVGWDDGIYLPTRAGDILYSWPGRNAWVSIHAALGTPLTRLAIDGRGWMWAGTDGRGVMQSRDHGATWAEMNTGLSDLHILSLHSRPDFRLVAGTPGGLFTSGDDGATWIAVPGSEGQRITACGGQENRLVYAAGETAMFGSTDDGLTWRTLPRPGHADVTSIVVSLSGKVVVGTDGDGLFVSVDSGRTWTARNATLRSLHITDLCFNSRMVLMVATHCGGEYISNAPLDQSLHVRPSLQTPTNDNVVGNSGLGVQFRWAGGDCSDFQFQVTSDSSMRTFNIADRLVHRHDTSYSLTSFELGETYFWRVRSLCAGSHGPWSVVFRMHMLHEVEPPLLISPADGEDSVSLQPSLSCEHSMKNPFLQYQVSESLAFDKIVFDKMNQTNACTCTPLQTRRTYYWRARMRSDLYISAWTAANRFTTITVAPDPPSLLSPHLGSQGLVTHPEFTWDSVASVDSYTLQIALDYDFTEIAAERSGITATSCVVPGLKPYTTYFWRVCGINGSKDVTWSQYWQFETGAGLPAVPVLIAPADGAANLPTQYALSWQEAPDATAYRVQLARDSALTSMIFDKTITLFSCLTPVLKSDSTYFWRVCSVNAYGVSDWSTLRRFTIAAASAVEASAAPEQFRLTVHPNPARGIAEAIIVAPHSAAVQVTITDLLGRVQRTVFNGDCPGGGTPFVLGLGSLPAGTYTVTVLAGGAPVAHALLVHVR